MEMKLFISLAIVTAVVLMLHQLTVTAATIAHHTTTPAVNASLSGFSLQLVDGADHEGLDHATVRRGSDGFLHLQSQSLLRATNSSAASPEMTTYTPLRLPSAVVVGVGTGRGHQDYLFQVANTPSTLIWMQCKGCDPYSLQRHPLFDLSASPTYHLVRGTDPFCQPPFWSDYHGAACGFRVTGPRGMMIEGYLGADTLTYSGKVDEHVPFGCAHEAHNFQNDGQFAGIIGAAVLGHGLTTFSYCLFHGGGDGETSRRRGFLRFGTDVPRNPRYRTTRILPALEGHEVLGHYVSLVGVSLGARRLDAIRPEMFARREDGEGGCVVDLGTPVTVMAEEAYGVVEEAVWSELRRHGAERVERSGMGYGLCVRASEDIKGRLQSLSMSLHFSEEEAVLVVAPEQLFLMVDDEEQVRRIACLAVKPGRRTVVGALQQVDTRFVFDLKESKLSFAPESCIQDTVEVV
ncbi:unnamed protein product [Urochloa decumbens]|uniref:Peptidase A1 domain-containing protein n=1 Tax=Urochloa decumbens TaxID=240449 RepID=A0ABC9E6M8_9POAL